MNFITFFKTSDSDEQDRWSEDGKHNMSCFKYINLVFKYYVTTWTLGKNEKEAKEKFYWLITPINEEAQEQDAGHRDTEKEEETMIFLKLYMYVIRRH